MKALSIRLDDKLGKEFDRVCLRTGYKKNTLLTRLIAAFVSHQKQDRSRRMHKDKDPFDAVIGLVRSEPLLSSLLSSEDDIDKVVYDL